MIEISIKLPEALAGALGDTPEARSRRLLENHAIEEYREGRLSHREIGELLGLDYWQAEAFLAERRVPLNYTAADLEADRETLAGLLGRS